MDAECRICLVNAFTSDHLLFKSILSEFESTGTSVKVSEAITKCTSVHVSIAIQLFYLELMPFAR